MISTDAFQVGFLSSLTIVNEGLSLTIVNKTTSFIKTIILKNDRFKNDHLKKTFKKRSFLKTRFRFFVVVFITKLSFFKKKMKTLTSQADSPFKSG